MSSLLKNNDRPNIKPNAIFRVMPLFLDKTASIPMVKHMNIGKCVTESLNPGQIPGLHTDSFA